MALDNGYTADYEVDGYKADYAFVDTFFYMRWESGDIMFWEDGTPMIWEQG